MPFDTTPGQVLSSVPSTSDKRRSSKLGGCASVLFQIFHGKRLFPRKSLPAERPKQAASNFADDKLPIAKLLFIADENRSGSIKDADEEIEVESGAMVESYEEKAPRRTPGVVARLMGLETMPSPDSGCDERKQCELRRNMDYELPMDAPQLDRHTSTAAAVQKFSSLQGVRTKEFKTGLPARFAACQRKKDQDGTSKSKVVAKSPSLPPHHLDASFPSSPKCDSLNKNSMRIQKTPHFFEAAPKILKANLQANRQTGSPRLQNSFSGAKTGSFNTKSQFTNFEAQAPCSRRDEVKAVQVARRHTSSDTISRRQIADPQKSQLTQQLILSNIKCSSHEAAVVNRKHGFQRALEQPKAVSTEKLSSDGRRQDETRRRLSQPTVCSSFKARPSRHPSPPKSFQDSSGGACSSQASNCMPSSSAGSLSSHLLKSHVGSNNVSARKHSSSSGRGSFTKFEGVDEVLDTMQPVESKHDKLADLRFGNSTISKDSDASHLANPEKSLFSQDGSMSTAIYTESLQRSSLESSISSDPSLSEFSTSSEECSNFSSVGEIVEGYKKVQGLKMTSDVSLMENSSESLSESVNVSSAGHIASSHTHSDDNSRSVYSAHTYSGRNTAAILQDLLTALSSSTQKKSSYAKKVEGTVSSSLDSELEKPHFLSADYGHCKEDLCKESTFQDSASSTSSDSSQLSQGIEEYEMDQPVTSTDCASISEMQGEEKYLLESSGAGRTQLQHGISRDCEALMSTLSKLHCIDPEVIGLKIRTGEDPSEQVIRNLASPFYGCLSDADKSERHTEQQLDHGLSSSSTLLADDDDSIYRSDVESSLINGYNEVAVWNKKLVTDCISEAFKSLSKQLSKVSPLSELPSATHVLSRVYKQLDEWRGMSSNMNLDNIIEKEMNLTTRSWRNIGFETEEVAEVVESTIFSGLLEEVLLEIM